MRPGLTRICIGACLTLLPARMSFAEFPQSVMFLKRSKDTIWLAEINPSEVAGDRVGLGREPAVGVITLFFKSGIVMYTKHETLRTVNGNRPFGFVEIGRFRPLK